jgi:4-amino-4-deoxy-L-arabinose transferase-like glycosyltransferase
MSKKRKTEQKTKVVVERTATTPTSSATNPALWLLGLSAIVFLQARLRLLAIPLDRDEGGFAYMGYHMLRGERLYTDMLDNKLPGLYMLSGVFTNVFGLNAVSMHLLLLVANVVTVFLFFKLIDRMYDRETVSWSTAILLLLLVSPTVFGFSATATQMVLPFTFGGFVLFEQGMRTSRIQSLFWSGICLGVAFLMKQPGVVFGLLAAMIWWPMRLRWQKHPEQSLPWREWVALGVGGVLPLCLTVLYFLVVGRFSAFYDATIIQPAQYMADVVIPSRFDLFKIGISNVTEGFWGVWVAALLGLGVVWRSNFSATARMFAVGLFILGLCSTTIGIAFYPHYFVLMLPGVALLAGVLLRWLSERMGRSGALMVTAITAILLIWAVLYWRGYFLKPDYTAIMNKAYGFNLGPELEKVGLELRRRTQPDEVIGILGSEPQVLVAAQRKSCSRHLYMYPLFNQTNESDVLRKAYFNDLDKAKPRYIVWHNLPTSWRARAFQHVFMKQLNAWTAQNYRAVGMIDVENPENINSKPKLIWGDDVANIVSARKRFNTLILERK